MISRKKWEKFQSVWAPADSREYGSGDTTDFKYNLFTEAHKSVCGAMNGMFPGSTKVFVDLTAGGYIDKDGRPNVLARTTQFLRDFGTIDEFVIIAFEVNPGRYETLCDGLRSDGLLADCPTSGMVYPIQSLFTKCPSLKPFLAGSIGHACFDPRPDLDSIHDCALVSEVLPQNFSISSYVGANSYKRMERGEEKYGRDGSYRSEKRFLELLKCDRPEHLQSRLHAGKWRVHVFSPAKLHLSNAFKPPDFYKQPSLFPGFE